MVRIDLKKLLLFLTLGVGAWAFAQTTTVNQGSPGYQGAWSQTPPRCIAPAHKVTSVSEVSAASVPSSNLSNRRFVQVCNSKENATEEIKCRIDGTDPTMGEANPGDVLGVGDCATYYVNSSVTVKCISDTAGTAVTTLECR